MGSFVGGVLLSHDFRPCWFGETMSQPANANKSRGLTLLAESDLLVQCIKLNRERLRAVLIRRDRSRRAAVRCLTEPSLSTGVEKAAQMAVALSLGTASDRIQVRTILRTHGVNSLELRSCLADSFGRIRHPAAAFLLLPMLYEVPPLVRETAFRSLVSLHHPLTAESLLAAVWADHRFLDTMVQETRRLTQRECNSIFESLERASVSEPRLASALQLIHSFVNARALSLRMSQGSGCLIAAERLQRSLVSESTHIEFAQNKEFAEYLDNWTEWSDEQAVTVQDGLTDQQLDLTPTTGDLSNPQSTPLLAGPVCEPLQVFLPGIPSGNMEALREISARHKGRLHYMTASRSGITLAAVTSLLLVVGFGISRDPGDLQTHPSQPGGTQPKVLRVSENPDVEPAVGLSDSPTVTPSSERSATTENQPTIRMSASSRQRD